MSDGSRWPVTRTPRGWTITVRCAAEVHPSESRPVVLVARCVGDGLDGMPPWQFETRGHTVAAGIARRDGGPAVVDGLREIADRWAYRLRCPRCPENLPIADEFELYDLMNARADAGKRSDTLQRIRASR